jgi:hypothetical protein
VPTISQLPETNGVAAADVLPLSQGGTTRGVSVGALLSGTQPAILAPTSSLLGRVSIGPGGPEPVAIGSGLTLQGNSLSATGADHSGFPQIASLSADTMLVIEAGGHPALLPAATLRSLFSGSSGVTVSQLGVISIANGPSGSGGNYSISSLPLISSLAAQDLIGTSHNGSDCAIPLSDLLNGQTIDMAQPATVASDTDTFWVAQGTTTMSRQTLAAVWAWLATKLTSYKTPVIEISTNTTLDGTVHNGRILLCTASLTLTAAPMNMGNGFRCDVLNVSSGSVTLAGGITTSSGQSALPAGQCMQLYVGTYSGGTAVYGWVSSASAASAAPGQTTNLAAGNPGPNDIPLSWTPPVSGSSVTGYVVSYRPSGTSGWLSVQTSSTATQYDVSALTTATSYDFMVAAVNGAVIGAPSNTVTITTSPSSGGLSPPTGLSITNVTSSSITLSWGAPTIGVAQNYTVQIRATGSTFWASVASGLTALTYTITGLVAGQSYDVSIIAVGSGGSSTSSIVTGRVSNAGSGTVASITWNVLPSGTVPHGSGAIGVNAHVSPSTAPIQFGLSTSSTILPASWVGATSINTDLWGAYIQTPALPGIWYVWAEGLDGSCPTVSPAGIVVT